jgi:hypothetical protein
MYTYCAEPHTVAQLASAVEGKAVILGRAVAGSHYFLYLGVELGFINDKFSGKLG